MYHHWPNYFIRNLYEIYNRCCPIRAKQVSYKSLKNPWIDQELANAIKYKFRLFKNYKRGLNSFQEYNLFKNSLQTIIKIAKINYFKLKFNQAFGDIKKTWQCINKYFLNKRTDMGIHSLMGDDRIYDSSLEIANIFSSYFSSIAAELDLNIPACHDDP